MDKCDVVDCLNDAALKVVGYWLCDSCWQMHCNLQRNFAMKQHEDKENDKLYKIVL